MSRAVRVLQVVGSMERAGVETWLMHVLRNIDRERFRFDFLVHTPRKCAYDDEIRTLGSNLYVCDTHSNPIRYSRKFLRIVREHGPFDVVHSHLQHFNGLVMWLANTAAVPTRIAHSHLDTTNLEAGGSMHRRLYLRLCRRWIQRHSCKRVATSPQAADSLFGPAWRGDADASVSFCGIDFRPFHEPVNRSDVRREFGFSSSDFVMGHVGRFMPQKNHDFLLRIYSEVLKTRPDTRLLLIGQGPLEEQIRSAAGRLGIASRVTVAGARPDVARLMLGAMDVFVMPSIAEGLGLAAVEAQAAGLPTFVSGHVPREADIGAGLVQFLSLAESAEAWAKAILDTSKRTIVSQREALSRSESSRFSLHASVADLCELYSSAWLS